MKLIIDIPREAYEAFKEWHKNKVATVEQSLIANGKPYEERPQGECEECPFKHTEKCDVCINRLRNMQSEAERPQSEFTDLEQTVIADSINYLLGAELLEENGYTEEVINALKSVLQKIGTEENHL